MIIQWNTCANSMQNCHVYFITGEIFCSFTRFLTSFQTPPASQTSRNFVPSHIWTAKSQRIRPAGQAQVLKVDENNFIVNLVLRERSTPAG